MSYTIDGYEINAAEYAVEDNTGVYLYTDNQGVVIKANTWPYWNDLISAHPTFVYIRPYKQYEYLVWDDINKKWVVDQGLFTPFLLEDIKNRREAGISSESLVELSITPVGKTAPENLGLKADSRTLLAIHRKATRIPVVNSSLYTVEYKFETFTSTGSTDIGYRDIDGSSIHLFFEALDDKNQLFFSAERFVAEKHATTPYDDIELARADFDNYIANN